MGTNSLVSRSLRIFLAVILPALFGIAAIAYSQGGSQKGFDSVVEQNVRTMMDQGRQTFRFDTFGDEAFWGGSLKLHQAIEGAKLGGVGPGVSPATALAVGLKVDVDALPSSL